MIFWQLFYNVVKNGVDVETFGGRGGHNDGTWYLALPVGYLVTYGLLVAQIYLVDDQDNRSVGVYDSSQYLLVLEGFAYLSDKQE